MQRHARQFIGAAMTSVKTSYESGVPEGIPGGNDDGDFPGTSYVYESNAAVDGKPGYIIVRY
jgi:hypothetical protein